MDPTNPNDFTHLRDHSNFSLQTCVVLHVSRDEDMRLLITTGLIWKGGPKTQRQAVTWLLEHWDVPLTRVPERIAAYITAQRVAS